MKDNPPDSASLVNDPERLNVLYRSEILDAPQDRIFDRVTEMVSRELNAPIALLSFVDIDRQFFMSQHGLPEDIASARETPLSHSLCKNVVEGGSALVIDDARAMGEFKDHPIVKEFGVVAYLGVPLVKDGATLGALCAIDMQERKWSQSDIDKIEKRASFIKAELNRYLKLHTGEEK